jgi:hypothetical protein
LRDSVEVSEPQRRRTHFVSIGEVLGLKDVNSVKFDPPLCSAFVKGEPKGDKVTLTGDEPFNSIVLPLTKSLDFTRNRFAAKSARPCLPALTLCVAVLDAPMVLAESPSTASDPVLRPWVRVFRQEA